VKVDQNYIEAVKNAGLLVSTKPYLISSPHDRIVTVAVTLRRRLPKKARKKTSRKHRKKGTLGIFKNGWTLYQNRHWNSVFFYFF